MDKEIDEKKAEENNNNEMISKKESEKNMVTINDENIDKNALKQNILPPLILKDKPPLSETAKNDNNNNNHYKKIKVPKKILANSYSENIIFTIKNDKYSKMQEQLVNNFSPQTRNKYYNNIKKVDYTFNKKRNLYKEQLKAQKVLTLEEKELEKIKQFRLVKNPIILSTSEKKKYLDIYCSKEVKNSQSELRKSFKNKNYSCGDFNETKITDKNSFKIFYQKMHRDAEIFRKGGEKLSTPSFNLIRATKEFRVVPNPIGVVKKEGDNHKLDLKNRGIGDNFLLCLNKSLAISHHISKLNLSKNRLSDMSLIPLFKTILSNNILLQKLTEMDLSFNKIGMVATELLCQYIKVNECGLEYLNLESNNLGNTNGRKIIEAISKNLFDKLKYLNLGQNNLTDDICIELKNLIKKCELLSVFLMYRNDLHNQGASLLMEEIKNHYNLKILDLSWNSIGTNLIDEIPSLDELIKVNKNPKNHFDNAYLNEIQYTLEFRKQNSTSPIKIGSTVSNFTNQLCELFHNKNTSLIHLDISYNNINAIDGKAISENIKDNHTILGIHVDGNDMYVDELGFVFSMEKSKYKPNHFANNQIFYRLDEEHPLIRSNIINIQKLRSKNNCWICEGWREIKFNYKPNKIPENFENSFVKLHLNFENYKSYELIFNDDSYICYRMCPPGLLNFFLTLNGIPIDNYGPITYNLKDAIIYTQELQKNENEEEELETEKESKKFIITKVAHINVQLNKEVINPKTYENLLKYCIPRPEKNKNFKKRPRSPWTFPISIWAWYGYDYNGEKDSLYNDAFEFDYDRCKFSKDKDLSEDDEIDLKNILRENYKKLIGTYKNLSSYLGWKIWQIGKNQISEFATSCTDLLDNKYVINDVLVKVTEVKSNAIDKQERKKNPNIPDNIIRHQFMMLLVKIAKDKYFRTKQIPSIPDAVNYAFEHNYNSYLNKFDDDKWRKERYYNEEVDNILKAFIPIFDAVFYSYAPQQIMGRKDSFWLTLDNFTLLCSNIMDADFPVKELPVMFNLSIRLQINEIDYDKHYNMIFPEFLEAICRFIDKLSPTPNQEIGKWDMKKRMEQPLYVKIETTIPKLMNLISGQYKVVRDKFIMPVRDEETGLFIINFENPLYEGKLPPKPKKKKYYR